MPILSFSLVASIIAKFQYIFYDEKDFWTGEQTHWVQKVVYGTIGNFALYWHNYEVHDAENLKRYISEGNVLLVGYHSRCTVDNVYLLSLLRPNVLATFLFYQVPIIKEFMPALGVIPSKSVGKKSTEDTFVDSLKTAGRPLMLLPGGVHECLRSYDQKFKVDWKDSPGFARVLCNRKKDFDRPVRVIPYFTENCENIFYTTIFWHDFFGNLNVYFYDQLRYGNIIFLPFMLTSLVLCMGFFYVPRPVKLDTYFGEPLELKENENPGEFSRRVAVSLQNLVDEVNCGKFHKETSKPPYEGKSVILFCLYGIYVFTQNLLGSFILFFSIWLTFPPLSIYYIYQNLSSKFKIS